MENNLSNLKPIEKDFADLSEFEGLKVPIENVIMIPVKSKYGLDGKALLAGVTIEVPVIKVETKKLSEITVNGKKVDLKGSELFNLICEQQEDKIIATGWNPQSKLGKFLAKHKVNKPEELKGKFVIIKIRPNNFLGFYTE